MIVDLGSWRKGTDTVTVPHHTVTLHEPVKVLDQGTFYKRVFGYLRNDVKWNVSSMIETIDKFVHVHVLYCILCTYRVQVLGFGFTVK